MIKTVSVNERNVNRCRKCFCGKHIVFNGFFSDNSIMNKKLISVCFFAVVLFPLFAKPFSADSPVRLHWSAGTSAVVYEDSSLSTFNSSLISDGFVRFVLSGDVGLSFILDNNLRFITGAAFCYDSYVKNYSYASYLDYAGFGGIRVYPGLAGFNFGVDYVTGQRANLVNIQQDDSAAAYSDSLNAYALTSWGNGYRFTLEYDFSVDTTGYAPVTGVSWRRVPRGGATDNIISIYFRLARK